MRLLRGPEAEVVDLAFSPDGTALAAGFKHHPVHLWNLEAGISSPVRLTAEGDYSSGGLQFSQDGRSIQWRESNCHRKYNRDGREYFKLSFTRGNLAHRSVMSPDGLRVISQHGMPDHCLVRWTLTEGGWVVSWERSIADVAVESLTLAPDGCLMAVIVRSAIGERWEANPRQVEVWDTATGKFVGKGDYPYAYAPVLLFAPNGRQLVGINDMTILVWPVPRLGEARLVRNDNRKDFTSAAYHPSGQRLYAGNNDGTVQVFGTATWECLDRFTWQIGKPRSVAVSADGTLAAAGGDRGDIVLWDVDE